MEAGMLLFKNVKPDIEFINSVLEYDVNKLESTDNVTISKYAMALAQYLVYFKSKVNETKVEMHRKQRVLDGAVAQLLTPEILKRCKTKSGACEFIISSTQELNVIRNEICNLKDELTIIDGVDRQISELIAVFKRELTRRENELYTTRKERYSK